MTIVLAVWILVTGINNGLFRYAMWKIYTLQSVLIRPNRYGSLDPPMAAGYPLRCEPRMLVTTEGCEDYCSIFQAFLTKLK
jgi:hypothetical protein